MTRPPGVVSGEDAGAAVLKPSDSVQNWGSAPAIEFDRNTAMRTSSQLAQSSRANTLAQLTGNFCGRDVVGSFHRRLLVSRRRERRSVHARSVGGVNANDQTISSFTDSRRLPSSAVDLSHQHCKLMMSSSNILSRSLLPFVWIDLVSTKTHFANVIVTSFYIDRKFKSKVFTASKPGAHHLGQLNLKWAAFRGFVPGYSYKGVQWFAQAVRSRLTLKSVS